MPDVESRDNVLGASDAVDTTLQDDIDDTGKDDLVVSDGVYTPADHDVSGEHGPVYVDVDKAELFTIDPDTGKEVDVDPNDVSDSSELEIVDDHQDGSLDDAFGSTDPEVFTMGDDDALHTIGDFSGADDDIQTI